MTAREKCPDCNGIGHIWRGEDVGPCHSCKGNGTILARDHAGRFMRLPDSRADTPPTTSHSGR